MCAFLFVPTADAFDTPRMLFFSFPFHTGAIQNLFGGAVILGDHGYFARNNATGVAVGTGGAVTTDRDSSFTMGNNHTFEECNSIGNAVTAYGGAFYLASSTKRRQPKRSTVAPHHLRSLTMMLSFFHTFQHQGFGSVLKAGNHITFRSNRITNLYSEDDGGFSYGGGLMLYQSTATFGDYLSVSKHHVLSVDFSCLEGESSLNRRGNAFPYIFSLGVTDKHVDSPTPHTGNRQSGPIFWRRNIFTV